MEPKLSPLTGAGMAPARPRTHPLVIAAALSIIVLSAIGIATLLYQRSGATATNLAAGGNANFAAASAPQSEAPSNGGGAPTPAQTGTLLSDGSVLAPIPDADAVPGTPSGTLPAGPALACPDCATVLALHTVKVEGQSSGLGAVGGGVVGGLLGNTLGSGRGRGVLTVLGAVGGAVAGNAIEKNAHAKVDYELVVRYDDGHKRYFKRAQPWPYSVGESVHVVKGEVLPGRG